MFEFLSVIKLAIFCCFLLTAVFLVLLALPQSQLRQVLMPIVGWALAIFCGIYCISPLDVMPEAFFGPLGLIDDFFALSTGIAAGMSAYQAQNDNQKTAA